MLFWGFYNMKNGWVVKGKNIVKVVVVFEIFWLWFGCFFVFNSWGGC